MITFNNFVAKRRERWEEKHDIEYDKKITKAIVKEIFNSNELLNEVVKKPYLLIECCFSIVDKEKKQVPFFFNDVQKDFIDKVKRHGTSKPFFILKGRQQGFTTLISAIQLSYAIVKKNFAGFTLADRDDNTKAIFTDKAKNMYNNLPERLKPTEKFNSTNELFFDKLNSSWRVASAVANVGRSRTLSFIHYSEVAFYKCSLADLQKSIAEATIKDAFVVYETTANGFNEAKELWDNNSCINLFYEWWRTKEYVSSEYEYLETSDTWLQKRLEVLKNIGLTKEQLTWYAKKYNSYIDKESIKQEYPCTPDEAFVSSGNCIFDKEKIQNYLTSFDIKPKIGYFEYNKVGTPVYDENKNIVDTVFEIKDIRFIESRTGYISIVDEPVIKEKNGLTLKAPYVIGADIAGTGTDYFTAKVLDNTTGKCVCTLRKQRIDEDLFAEQLFCLGKYYNEAFIGVETNYSRQPVKVLKKLGYSNIYIAKDTDAAEDKSFTTSIVTRPVIVSNLVSVMRENICLETDKETLKEMLTFVKHDDGKQAAAVGSHDDLVMASAIAHFIAINYEHNFIETGHESNFITDNFKFEDIDDNTFIEW